MGLLLVFQQSSSSPEVQSTPSPVTGGIYTEALVGQFSRFNPILDMNNQADKDVDRLLFNGLIRFDSSGMPQPDLAETWSYSSDGTRFTFSMRANAYWHDGQPVTAEDVVYTMGLLREESELIPADLRAFWSEIQVSALSDTLVEFALPEAFSPFLDYLSVPLLPSHLLGNLTLAELVDHPFNTAPVGTGPYKFSRFLVKDGVIRGVDLLPNENYYLGRPYIDEVVFQYYPNMRDAWTAYQGGEVDGLAGVSNEILPEVLAEPGLNLFSTREPRLSMVFLNLDNPAKDFLQDAEFRQALMLAINRQMILDKVMLVRMSWRTGLISCRGAGLIMLTRAAIPLTRTWQRKKSPLWASRAPKRASLPHPKAWKYVWSFSPRTTNFTHRLRTTSNKAGNQ